MELSNTSHFSNDLGLDSLDTVEVVMAIEEVRNFHAFENLALMKFAGIQYRDSRQRGGCYSQQYVP